MAGIDAQLLPGQLAKRLLEDRTSVSLLQEQIETLTRQDNGCRLVLAGDTKQHRGVQRGDALRVLEASGAIAQVCLDKNYRQKNLKLRSAIDELSKGRTEEGFDELDQCTAILEFKDPKERLKVIADLHLEAKSSGQSSLIVAPTHNECREIARTVREWHAFPRNFITSILIQTGMV